MGKTLIYQLLPRLWGNVGDSPVKDGTYSRNGSGKFSDIDADTIAYLKYCGYTHIWLTGVIRHSCCDASAMGGLGEGQGGHISDGQFVKGLAGSPYAIQDYFDVNPYLADVPQNRIEEFKSLIGRCHEAGLKVLIDFVPNHVARDYGVGADASIEGRPSAGMELGAGDDRSVHWSADNDFFYYPGQRLVLPNENEWKAAGKPLFEEYPAKASGNSYSPAPGINDWYETVKLNYCDFHTPTWDKMLGILMYWRGMGVDGFRCDMVELVPYQFFSWAIASVKRQYPETLFVAEVYNRELYRRYIREVGFDLLYDKSGLYDALVDIVQHNGSQKASWPPEAWQSTTRLTSAWQYLGDLQPYMLNFLENHDEPRFCSDGFAGSGEGASLIYPATAASLLFNTSAYMTYFGEEAGERGMDDEGFSGVNGRTSIFDWWRPQSLQGLWKLVHSGRYADIEENIQPLIEETGLSERILRRFARLTELVRLAANDDAISRGVTYDLCYCNFSSRGFDRNRHFAFLRDFGDETLLIAANFSPQNADMELHIPEHAFEWLELTQSDSCNASNPVRVTVPAFDAAILRLS